MEFISIKNNNFTYDHYAYQLSPEFFQELEKLYYDKTLSQESIWVIRVDDNYYEFRCKKEDNSKIVEFCYRYMSV